MAKFNILSKDAEYFFIPSYVIAIIAIGTQIRKVDNPKTKQIYCTLVGLLSYGFCVGNMIDIYVIMLMKLTNTLIIRLIGPKRCHIYSLVVIFTMSTLLRVMIVMKTLRISFLADLMVLFLVLKLVGFAFWINSQYVQKQNPSISVNQIVSLYDEISYYFCYCGMIVGPCISYPTYNDMLHMNSLRNKDNIQIIKLLPSFFDIISEDLLVIIYLTTATIIAKSSISYEYFMTDRFLYEDSLLTKVWWITVCATLIKYRLYIAFILARWTCKGLGVGAYPVASKPKALIGPTLDAKPLWVDVTQPQDITFVTINNINIYDMEFGYTYGGMVRHWNITVQSWLAHNIYRGLSFKRRSHGRMATFIVSALWHGINPGHYLTFGTAIGLLSLESRLVYFCNTHLKNLNPTTSLCLKFTSWFLLNRLVDYAVMGFCILQATPLINLWKSVYFYGHVGLFSALIIALMAINIPKSITHRITITATTATTIISDEKMIKTE